MEEKENCDFISEIISSIPAVFYEYEENKCGLLKCTYISPKCREILGIREDYFFDQENSFWNLIRDEKMDVNKAILNSLHFFTEIKIFDEDKKERWIQLSSLPCKKKVDGSVIWRGFLFDITERKRKEEKTLEIAKFDYLTGFLTKRYFYYELEKSVKKYIEENKKSSLLFIDLDNFKCINDKFGHLQGDKLLTKLSEKIKGIVGESAYIGRFGGDEFAVLFKEEYYKEARNISEKIKKSIEERAFSLCGIDLKLTVSGGFAEMDNKCFSPFLLVEKADKAMYLAKSLGKNTIVVAE